MEYLVRLYNRTNGYYSKKATHVNGQVSPVFISGANEDKTIDLIGPRLSHICLSVRLFAVIRAAIQTQHTLKV